MHLKNVLIAVTVIFASAQNAFAQTPASTLAPTSASASASTPIAVPTTTPATPSAGKPENGLFIDGIVATVGDEVILYSDLQRAVKHASNNQISLEAGGKLKGEGSEKDVAAILDQLIDQRVLSARIRELGLSLSDEELSTEIQNFLKNQNITAEKFQEVLAQEGETNEGYRDEFKRQMETQRFIGRSIRPLVSATDDELRNYYLQQNAGKTQNNGIKKIKLRSLMVSTPRDASDDTKKTKQDIIKKIQGDIAANKNFEEVVKSYSEDPQATKNGGVLAPKLASELPPEVRNSLKDAKEGRVLGPFILGGATFFFQYLGLDVSDNSDFLQQKSALESKLLETKFQERLNEFVKSERSKLKIEKFDIKITK